MRSRRPSSRQTTAARPSASPAAPDRSDIAAGSTGTSSDREPERAAAPTGAAPDTAADASPERRPATDDARVAAPSASVTSPSPQDPGTERAPSTDGAAAPAEASVPTATTGSVGGAEQRGATIARGESGGDTSRTIELPPRSTTTVVARATRGQHETGDGQGEHLDALGERGDGRFFLGRRPGGGGSTAVASRRSSAAR